MPCWMWCWGGGGGGWVAYCWNNTGALPAFFKMSLFFAEMVEYFLPARSKNTGTGLFTPVIFIGGWPDGCCCCCLLYGFRSELCWSVRVSFGAMPPLLSMTSSSWGTEPGVGVDATAIWTFCRAIIDDWSLDRAAAFVCTVCVVNGVSGGVVFSVDSPELIESLSLFCIISGIPSLFKITVLLLPSINVIFCIV